MGWNVSLRWQGTSAPPLGHGMLTNEDTVGTAIARGLGIQLHPKPDIFFSLSTHVN